MIEVILAASLGVPDNRKRVAKVLSWFFGDVAVLLIDGDTQAANSANPIVASIDWRQARQVDVQ